MLSVICFLLINLLYFNCFLFKDKDHPEPDSREAFEQIQQHIHPHLRHVEHMSQSRAMGHSSQQTHTGHMPQQHVPMLHQHLPPPSSAAAATMLLTTANQMHQHQHQHQPQQHPHQQQPQHLHPHQQHLLQHQSLKVKPQIHMMPNNSHDSVAAGPNNMSHAHVAAAAAAHAAAAAAAAAHAASQHPLGPPQDSRPSVIESNQPMIIECT